MYSEDHLFILFLSPSFLYFPLFCSPVYGCHLEEQIAFSKVLNILNKHISNWIILFRVPLLNYSGRPEMLNLAIAVTKIYWT